jgi:hypothetical protein
VQPGCSEQSVTDSNEHGVSTPLHTFCHEHPLCETHDSCPMIVEHAVENPPQDLAVLSQ